MIIPENSNDLTPAWFAGFLSERGDQVNVKSVHLEQLGVGAGMMSTMYRARLTYAGGSGPDTLIVKLPTAMTQNRGIAAQFDNYRREVEFYRRAAHATPMRTASVYLAEHDGPDNFVLVLEDLGNWELGDQIAGCSLDRATAVMEELAALHGAFWNGVDRAEMDWLPDNYPSVMSDGLASGTEASWEGFVINFADLLPDSLRDARLDYLDGLPRVQAWMNDRPRTIVHGDYRMDNLFFRETGNGIEVACCDFQAPVRGKGIQDVAYFLSASIDTEMRRTHEHDLIRHWLDSLSSQGIDDYQFDQALLDYRMGILMLWTYVVIVGGGMTAENERGDNWVSAMVERSIASMQDHDCLSLLA